VNRLAQQSSPYLQQHADNPVDWYPWGPEAIQRAQRENKPIFLSIGYSACHWCHVMEHESFEDEEIARFLNEHFVSIKVDREERPDLDAIYMQALQVYLAMSGSPQGGGWPLSMFLTPDLRPFFGGTYWPPRSDNRYGRPGFLDVLRAVARFWSQQPEATQQQAEQITAYLQQEAPQGSREALSVELLWRAAEQMQRHFDARHGGFGRAPKFPHALDVRLLLRLWHRDPRAELLHMALHTLEHMARGGIHDQLGGGFHRYTVDERWLVPHFEKMLYDNALLARCYAEACQATGQEAWGDVARRTCDYVLRDMTHPEGPFYSATDADSEGEEGKYFVWTPDEIRHILGPDDARTFCYVYDVTQPGNFEGRNILHLPKTISQCAKLLECDEEALVRQLEQCRRQLLAARQQRVPPARDEKVLANWNALMTDALAFASAALGEPRYLQAAERSAQFMWQHMRRSDGRLYHTWRDGTASVPGFLDDHAGWIDALITLYEASADEQYVDQALQLAEVVQRHFADADSGTYFFVADDHERLIARHRDVQDNPTPSGNALVAQAFVRLGQLTARADLYHSAQRTLQAFSGVMRDSPLFAGQMLLALDRMLGPAYELVLLGRRGDAASLAAWQAIVQHYLPRSVLAAREIDVPGRAAADPVRHSPALQGLFAGKEAPERPALYVCREQTCHAPLVGLEQIARCVQQMAQPPAQ
jgi:uncharacterized protein YyaL (SSP411 family)